MKFSGKSRGECIRALAQNGNNADLASNALMDPKMQIIQLAENQNPSSVTSNLRSSPRTPRSIIEDKKEDNPLSLAKSKPDLAAIRKARLNII